MQIELTSTRPACCGHLGTVNQQMGDLSFSAAFQIDKKKKKTVGNLSSKTDKEETQIINLLDIRNQAGNKNIPLDMQKII